MPATLKNRFWELRSKHGRDKLFKTPDLLWQAACEYFKWCEDNPLMEADIKVVDKSIKDVEIPKMRPFTIHGLCLYLGISTGYFREFKTSAIPRKNKKDFMAIINRIEDVLYTQKFSGAAAGLLNANIISRDLGLTDKQQIQGNFNLSDEDIIFS